MTIRMIKTLKRLIAVALLTPALAFAAAAPVKLDKAPVSMDQASLQHGAKLFVNYCLNCHSASFVRYNTLTQIGLTEDQIRDNLMFTGERVGDLMTIAMRPAEAKAWFGKAPPDLALVVRQRGGANTGADWLYTYLRQFYRDPDRPNGWNNAIFANVGMPHVLWELQGDQVATSTDNPDGSKNWTFETVKAGTMSADQYDKAVADLVSFLVWTAEPGAEKRRTIGVFVLIFLAGFAVLAYALKKNYWKDIH